MSSDIIKEYLVKLGVDISASQIKKFKNTLNWFDNSVINFFKRVNSPLVFTGKSYYKITQSLLGFAQSVARSDMDMQRWAKTMYLSTESAKALDRTLSAMDLEVEDLRDVALNPELMQQYKSLITLSNTLSKSFDTNESLRGIRQITYEFQKLKVILEYLKEKVVSYMWNIFKRSNLIGDFRNFNDWLVQRINKIAKAVGTILGYGVNNLIYAGRLVTNILGLFNKFSPAVKTTIAAITAGVALLMSGPFGKIFLLLQTVGMLFEDYLYYKMGWDSANFLKPLWEFVDNIPNILNNIGFWVNQILEKIKQFIIWLLEDIPGFDGLVEKLKGPEFYNPTISNLPKNPSYIPMPFLDEAANESALREESSKDYSGINNVYINVHGTSDPIKTADRVISAIRNTTSGVVV